MLRDGEHGLLGILKELYSFYFDVNIFMMSFNNISISRYCTFRLCMVPVIVLNFLRFRRNSYNQCGIYFNCNFNYKKLVIFLRDVTISVSANLNFFA